VLNVSSACRVSRKNDIQEVNYRCIRTQLRKSSIAFIKMCTKINAHTRKTALSFQKTAIV